MPNTKTKKRSSSGNPKNLKCGGKKPRETLSQQEEDFCVEMALHGITLRAARFAGIKASSAWRVRNRPLIQERITHHVTLYAKDAEKRALERAERLDRMADGQFEELLEEKDPYIRFKTACKVKEMRGTLPTGRNTGKQPLIPSTKIPPRVHVTVEHIGGRFTGVDPAATETK